MKYLKTTLDFPQHSGHNQYITIAAVKAIIDEKLQSLKGSIFYSNSFISVEYGMNDDRDVLKLMMVVQEDVIDEFMLLPFQARLTTSIEEEEEEEEEGGYDLEEHVYERHQDYLRGIK